jgi:hypothetical protein
MSVILQAKAYVPKVTGSMSFPGYGFAVLALSAVMLFSMDSFLGFGFISLLLFGRSLDWEVAYAPMLKRALGAAGKTMYIKDPDKDCVINTSGSSGSNRANDAGLHDTDSLLAELEKGNR